MPIASLLVSFDRLDCLDVGSGKVSICVYVAVGVEFATNGLNGHSCGARGEGGALAEPIADLLCWGRW